MLADSRPYTQVYKNLQALLNPLHQRLVSTYWYCKTPRKVRFVGVSSSVRVSASYFFIFSIFWQEIVAYLADRWLGYTCLFFSYGVHYQWKCLSHFQFSIQKCSIIYFPKDLTENPNILQVFVEYLVYIPVSSFHNRLQPKAQAT